MPGAGKGEIPLSTKIILSHHDYDETPGDDVLDALVRSVYVPILVLEALKCPEWQKLGKASRASSPLTWF